MTLHGSGLGTVGCHTMGPCGTMVSEAVQHINTNKSRNEIAIRAFLLHFCSLAGSFVLMSLIIVSNGICFRNAVIDLDIHRYVDK